MDPLVRLLVCKEAVSCKMNTLKTIVTICPVDLMFICFAKNVPAVVVVVISEEVVGVSVVVISVMSSAEIFYTFKHLIAAFQVFFA